MKQLGISIIGTDTDVGKTFVTGLLGAMAVDDGFAVGMVKPVSSSAVPFPECVTMDDVKAIIVNDTTAVDPFLLKTNVEDMERYTGIPVVAVVPPYQGPDIRKVQLGWARSFVDSKKVWNTVLGI